MVYNPIIKSHITMVNIAGRQYIDRMNIFDMLAIIIILTHKQDIHLDITLLLCG